jgi:hypothetical protein
MLYRAVTESPAGPIRAQVPASPLVSRIGALRGLAALWEWWFSARHPVYRVRQFVFCLVESVFRFGWVTLARLVNREHGFLGFHPLPGSLEDGSFIICHGPILADRDISVGTVLDYLVPFAPEYRNFLRLAPASIGFLYSR